jgi:hypothetical protein
MAENDPKDLRQLAGMLDPYPVNRVREVLLSWLRDGHEAARGERAASARDARGFVTDRYCHLVDTAPLLRDRLAELRAEPSPLRLTIESTGVLLHPFLVHPGPHHSLPASSVAGTRKVLSDRRMVPDLKRLVLLPWADVDGQGCMRLWAGLGSLSGDKVAWNWLVALTNEIPDVSPQETYPYRLPHVQPSRDPDTEEYYDHLADEP